MGGSVFAAADEVRTVGTERDVIDGGIVRVDDGEQAARAGLPQSNGKILAGSGDEPFIRTPDRFVDVLSVSTEDRQDLAVGSPDSRGTVAAGRQNPGAGGIEVNVADFIGVAAKFPYPVSGRDVPNANDPLSSPVTANRPLALNAAAATA